VQRARSTLRIKPGASSIGRKIKQARLRLHLRQEDLARRIEVEQSAVSNWELGKKSPDLENRIRLAAALDLSLGELLPEAGNVSAEVFSNPQVRRLVENFLALPSDTRRTIEVQVLGLVEHLGRKK
jgi:transcriptional regulator with XRE-family HTH domain